MILFDLCFYILYNSKYHLILLMIIFLLFLVSFEYIFIILDGTNFDVYSPCMKNGSSESEILKPFHSPQIYRNDLQIKYVEYLYDKVLVDVECTHEGSVAHMKKLDEKSILKFLDKDRLDNLENLQVSF